MIERSRLFSPFEEEDCETVGAELRGGVVLRVDVGGADPRGVLTVYTTGGALHVRHRPDGLCDVKLLPPNEEE